MNSDFREAVESLHDWSPTGYSGIDRHVLFQDPSSGMSTVAYRMQPGARVPEHIHTALEQTYVLAGEVTDENGTHRAGQLACRQPGSRHAPYTSTGAVVLSFGLRPNEYAGQ